MNKTIRSMMCPEKARRLVFAMALFLVIGSLLAPVMPMVEAATVSNINTADTNALQGGDLVPLDQDSEENPPPAEGEEPPVDNQPNQQLQPDPATLATVYVSLYWCPGGTGADTAPDGNAIKPACNLQGSQVGVTLTSTTNSAPPQSGTATSFPGQVTFGQLNPDTWSLSFNAPDATAQGVFCDVYTSNGNTKPYARYAFVQQGVALDTLNGELNIYCDWFGEATPATADTSVTIYKWLCPPDTDYAGQPDDYSAKCATEQAGVSFTITDDNGPQGTTSDTNGRQIDGLVGEIEIEESIPDGFGPPVVYCQLLNDPAPTRMPVTAGKITLAPNATDDYQCFWYNLPDIGTTVTIYKWQCPDGTMTGQDDDYYSAECATEQAGVLFDVKDDNGTEQTTSDTNGRQIEELFGDITITEMVPDGYDNPAIFCQRLNDEDPTDYSSGNGSVTLPPSQDDPYQCRFYNIPGAGITQVDGSGNVMVYKFSCTTTPPQDAQYTWYAQNCTTPMDDVTFVLDTPSVDIQTDTGNSIPGAVMMGGVEAGTYPLTETVPAGFTPAAVFCATVGMNDVPTDSQFAAQPLTANSIQATVTADMTFFCHWYNLQAPGEGISLTIYKWQCPQGTMYGQTESYYSAECATEHPGVPFQITSDNGTVDFMSDTNGHQVDNLRGQVILREMGLPGYGDPVVYCQLLNDNNGTLYTSTNGIVTLPPAMGDDYQCFWYNIPEQESTVTVYKWRCPDGMPAEQTQQWFEANCKSTPMDGVRFTLTDSNGPRDRITSGGMVQWTEVASGAVQLKEAVPPGFDPRPFIVCEFQNSITTEFQPILINGVWNETIEHPGINIICDWYNWYLGPGEITVYKWLCPEGYDRHAWGADPKMDCTEKVNGITFKLDQPDPGVDLFSDTGDSVDSAVYFGGLEPGDYTITEMVGAGEFRDIFVWECVGLNWSAVHPIPLSVGQNLDFKIMGGDKIECHWFNVPYPEYGYMVVHKFNCSTEKYVSDVYCYTNQTGQYFDLQTWNGSTWSTVQSGTTDVSGKVTFNNLDTGDYRLIEPNTQACLMKSSNITPGGNIGVVVGEGTTVYVYNCKTPPPPQKTPGKYPNTGVGPTAESEPMRTPGVALTGLAGLMGLAMSRRRVVAGAGLVTAGTAATALSMLNAQELVPLDSTPAPGTPAPDDFWCATPMASTPGALIEPDGAATPTFDPCNRGPIPIHMRIPIIEVDAPIEYLEIIDGLMEQPTDDTHIAWYKETSRLGEVGNGLYAAHVNWWGNPEGIFFRLESLQEGDVIEIDGGDAKTYLFEVQWTEDFPSDEEPPDEALGLTDEVAITLITCGGEWSSELSEYDHRTLVRAVLRE